MDKIKSHEKIKNIKVFDRATDFSSHMKDAFIKTKDAAVKTQDSGQSNPENYASDTMTNQAERSVRELTGKLKNPHKKAANHINNSKSHLQQSRQHLKDAKSVFDKTAKTRSEFARDKTRKNAERNFRKRTIKTKNLNEKTIGDPAKKDMTLAKRKLKTSIKKPITKPYKREVIKKPGNIVRRSSSPTRSTADKSIKAVRKSNKTIKKSAKNIKATSKNVVKATGKSVKTAERTAKTAVKTAQQSAKAAQATTKATKMAVQASRAAIKATVQATKIAIKTTISTVKAIIAAAKALVAAIAAGGWVAVVIILIVVLFCSVIALFGGGSSGNTNSYIPVSAEVNAYEPLIQKYATEHGIPDYVELIKAVMMQESGGIGNDPMQAAECGFNTKYPNVPNGITDPEYSVNVGIQNLASCLKDANVENPIDMENIKLALQGYNFGNGYISWAITIHGGYSITNAIDFSSKMANQYGWASYGDTQYVPRVLRYYPFGHAFTSGGNQMIVEVALSQVGNQGGQPYWSWYGLSSRTAWCAIYVSWCAEQCGFIDAGIIPKFAYCPTGILWFQERGLWQDGSYIPNPGDIIFFDWESDGVSDHVGIVEKVENGIIYTIEGNSSDACRQRQYSIGSRSIVGYGTPAY